MKRSTKINALVQLIQESGKTLALTGAGVSTGSGIPDFRSSSGLWDLYDPEEVASIQSLRRDPAKFYKFNLRWWEDCLKARPNSIHGDLAKLEQLGWLLGVVTQNIDGLHQRAGSERVWEVHGHLRTCCCLGCGAVYPFSILREDYQCSACGEVLRPDVVLFADSMPEAFSVAKNVLSGCQLLLAIGTSLQVQPVAQLPMLARRLVIINQEPTPLDDQADLVFHEDAAGLLQEVVDRMGQTTGPFYIPR